jgi:arylsulfatase A-like enzyme
MLNEKYQQDVYFCGIVGALVGIADGIFICSFFSYQLNTFLLKLLYVIFSLNFFAIIGVIVGFVFGMISTFLRLEKIKKILMSLFLLLFLFAYIGFIINVFSHNTSLSIYLSLFDLPNKNYEIIRILATFVIALFLYLLYERIFNIIQLKWKNFLLILLGMLFVDLSIWFSHGQKSKTDKTSASNIRLEKEDKQFKDNFKLPPDFKPPENLLIIIADTLRADHLSCYGYSRKTSPFIDELSQRGILFENAIAQGTCTSPSIASLYTGLYSMDHGVYMVNTILPDNVFTLAESYLQNGFVTQSIKGNFFVSHKFNYDQGFQGFVDCFQEVPRINDAVYKNAVKWLEQKREKPFFLYLHFMDPHGPYTPPKQYDRFTSDKKRSTKKDIRTPTPSGYKHIGRYALVDGHWDLDYYLSKYDGEILYTDDLIRKVFNKLDQLKLTKKTLVILTSDHGEGFGEHGDYFDHGYLPYDDCAKVPFILYYENGHFPIKSIKQTIELIDVYPTVHEMMKLTYEKNKIKGRSFLPLLFGKNISNKKAFLEAAKQIGLRIKDPVEFSSHIFSAIRDENWKLIYTPWLPKTDELYSFNFIANIYARLRRIIKVTLFPQRARYELYDIIKDPGETKNLYKPDLPIAQELIKELNKKNNQKNRKVVFPLLANEIDKKTMDQIKALGYVQ